MTLNFVGTLCLLMFIMSGLCFLGLLPSSWILGLLFLAAGGILAVVIYLVW